MMGTIPLVVDISESEKNETDRFFIYYQGRWYLLNEVLEIIKGSL